MTRRAKTYLFVVGSAFLLLVGIPLWFVFGPPRRVVVSKETTALTQPLNENGDVDYVKAFVDARREGVTADNNAAIPLAEATWPCGIAPTDRALVCRELGIAEPDVEVFDEGLTSDRYRQLITAWASEKWGVDLSDSTRYDFRPNFFLNTVKTSPWRRADYPPLAQWVDDYAQRIDRLHDMEGLDKFYFPSPKLSEPGATLISDNGLGTNAMRYAARALLTRSMMHIGAGEAPLAWRDLRMIFVLSRIRPLETPQFDIMVNLAIEEVAFEGTKKLLNSGHCSRALLDEMWLFLSELPPPASLEAGIDSPDRWMTLEFLATTSQPVEKFLREKKPANATLLRLPYDKNTLLRRLNQRFDQIASISKIDDPAKYIAAVKRYEDGVKADRESWNDGAAVAAAILSQSVRGVYVADHMTDWLTSGLAGSKKVMFRTRANAQLLRIAIRLEEYRLANGDYPATLKAIESELDSADMLDIYAAGETLIYERRSDGGYLLYSRFENGVDDKGTSRFGEILKGEWKAPNDYSFSDYENVDLVFRLPLPPPPQLKKPSPIADRFSKFEKPM